MVRIVKIQTFVNGTSQFNPELAIRRLLFLCTSLEKTPVIANTY